jgi:cation transport ATPase
MFVIAGAVALGAAVYLEATRTGRRTTVANIE